MFEKKGGQMPKKAAVTKVEPVKTEAVNLSLRLDPVNVSLRLDPALHERLRKMAFDKRKHMHPFIVEAIETALKAAKY
jgi:predicted HicB family RNase H-like nuclease